MTEAIQKISGWVLLAAGLIIIFWAVQSSYNIFTGKNAVPEIFKIEKQETAASKEKTQGSEAQMQQMVGEAISEQLKGFLPADTLPKLLNLISWSIFAGILILAGSQVSTLGIKLIKK